MSEQTTTKMHVIISRISRSAYLYSVYNRHNRDIKSHTKKCLKQINRLYVDDLFHVADLS